MSSLSGLRVLVVEDEFLVAIGLEAVLQDLGCEILGPAPDIDSALDLARREEFDCAILDVNLNGSPVYPVARYLAEKDIDFILTTGYEGAALPDDLRDRPRLRKPYDPSELEKLMVATFCKV
ncbi:response regulator [Telmatospirillum sp. J64-1]|uniref:response regulator n=1 Tax=Telmatospirillum sp. J64-1 TaxID=2502183 RepID=UPI00115DBD92|nr:response regulator [Telmatospirillum sp. J64-1]